MIQRSLIFGACLALAFGWISCDGDDGSFTSSSSSSSSSSGTGGEGGSSSGGTGGEGGSSSGGTGGEGGSSSSGTGGEGGGEVVVDCGGLSCVSPDICCSTGGGTQTACMAESSCNGMTLSCDDQEDCGTEICCHTTNPAGFSCQPACGGSAGGMVVCDGPADPGCPVDEPNCCLVMNDIVSVCMANCT